MDVSKERRLGGVAILMKSIEYLFGSTEPVSLPFEPYSDIACAFCQALSQELLKDKNNIHFPDITALAFWCRKANILQLKQRFGNMEKRLGRGLAFHITPSNIPVNFAFSFLFSLLSGNGNIVRIPSKKFPQITVICETIWRILERKEFVELRNRTTFLSYPSSDNEATAFFSKMADVRIIWGGDAAIDAIRRMPSKPRCVDLCFADRYSVAVIDGQAVLTSEDKVFIQQVEGFYNDTYLMDQNACSSPQIIFWYNESLKAKERFWKAVFREAQRRYTLQAASSVNKYVQLCRDVICLPYLSGIRRKDNLLMVASLKELPQDTSELRGQCGYFYEFDLEDLSQLATYINGKYQTVTYFGVQPEKICEIVLQNQLMGVDRIVPFGKAMDIGIIWDGYDIIRSLSRIVALQ